MAICKHRFYTTGIRGLKGRLAMTNEANRGSRYARTGCATP
jgi:hypothetical protein